MPMTDSPEYGAGLPHRAPITIRRASIPGNSGIDVGEPAYPVYVATGKNITFRHTYQQADQAINGIDAVTIIRYISALCITPGSIFPNTTFKIKFLHA